MVVWGKSRVAGGPARRASGIVASWWRVARLLPPRTPASTSRLALTTALCARRPWRTWPWSAKALAGWDRADGRLGAAIAAAWPRGPVTAAAVAGRSVVARIALLALNNL